MSAQPPRSYTMLAIAIVVAALVVGLAVFASSYAGTTTTVTNSTTVTDSSTITYTTTVSSACTTIFPGQPLGAQIRILNDTNLTPVSGALVTATAAVSGLCGNPTNSFTTSQFTTTNGTEWYSLPTENIGTLQIVVSYLGHSYALTMSTGLSIFTCGTLYIPSGLTNVTTTGAAQTPCDSASASTSTSTTGGGGTTTITTSDSSVTSLPPPITTMTDFGCDISSVSPEDTVSVLVNTTSTNDVQVKVSTSPILSLEGSSCSYTYTNTTTPTACGVMCGGGIGYTEAVSYVWKLNFSLSSPDTSGGYNLTIASESGLAALFPLPYHEQIYLNSQQLTSWYSNPPCYGGEGIESDCMMSNATSIAIELPASNESSAYQLVISSAEFLVP